MLEVVVDMASSVVMVRATLAGADLWSSQKDIQETDTVMEQGTYTVTMKKESWRQKRSFTLRQE